MTKQKSEMNIKVDRFLNFNTNLSQFNVGEGTTSEYPFIPRIKRLEGEIKQYNKSYEI